MSATRYWLGLLLLGSGILVGPITDRLGISGAGVLAIIMGHCWAFFLLYWPVVQAERHRDS